MPGFVDPLVVDVDEGVAGGEPPVGESNVDALGLDRLEPETKAEPAQERRARRKAARDAVALQERGDNPWPPEPFERDYAEALAVEPPHHLARPRLAGARGPLRVGHEPLRPQEGVPVAEERVRIGHPFVRAAGDPQHRLPAPNVCEREGQAVDLDHGTALDQTLRVLRVPLGIGAACEPPAVLSPLGRPQSGVGEHVLRAHVLPSTERLEDRPAGKLVRPVAEHRPVRDLARRRPAGPHRVQDPARAAGGQGIQVGGRRRLARRLPPEDLVRTVSEPVQQYENDRVHGGRG